MVAGGGVGLAGVKKPLQMVWWGEPNQWWGKWRRQMTPGKQVSLPSHQFGLQACSACRGAVTSGKIALLRGHPGRTAGRDKLTL